MHLSFCTIIGSNTVAKTTTTTTTTTSTTSTTTTTGKAIQRILIHTSLQIYVIVCINLPRNLLIHKKEKFCECRHLIFVSGEVYSYM